jgi:hypothetical protein
MTEKEVKEYDWLGSAPVIEFTDGNITIASTTLLHNCKACTSG